jgi:hypothetical protein
MPLQRFHAEDFAKRMFSTATAATEQVRTPGFDVKGFRDGYVLSGGLPVAKRRATLL